MMFGSIEDDSEEKDDTKRKSRNLSEKKRRDQFNLLVNELSVMVTSSTCRKMDKSTVLKSTIGFMKNHNEVAVRSKVHEIQEDWKPSFLSNEEFTHIILEALDAFIIVFSASGRILYASEGITALLGYLPTDLPNMTIYDMAFEEEHSSIYNILRNPPAIVGQTEDVVTPEHRVHFQCHLKRGELDFRDDVSYEDVKFTGFFRENTDVDSIPISVSARCGVPNEFDSKIIFVGTIQIQRPQLIREMSITSNTKSEFTSRHSLEWKFLFLDHRAPPIIGYLPFEVLGTSGYDYYHFDDLEQVVNCHEALKQKGEGTSCYYRFLTKGQQWLWLQTRYYITYHQWTSKPEFVMCTHRVINYMDVVQQMRRNNGKVEEINDVDDSADSVERQLNTSASSMMITSPWSTRSLRSRKHDGGESPSRVRQRNHTYCGNGSTDNINHDRPEVVHQFSEIQHSTGSKLRPHSQSVRASPNRHTSSFRSSSSYMGDSASECNSKFSLPTLTGNTFHTPVMFTPNPALACTDQPHPSLVITSPQPNHLQDELQRKQEELQQMIVHQQDELRRVSEQLLLARYGGPIVSVALPIAAPINVSVPAAIIAHNQIPVHAYVHHQHPQQHLHQSQLVHQQSHHPYQMQLSHEPHTHHPSAAGACSPMVAMDSDEMVSYMQLQPVNTISLGSHQQMLEQYSHMLIRPDESELNQAEASGNNGDHLMHCSDSEKNQSSNNDSGGG